MRLRDVVVHVRRRPGMFCIHPTYAAHVAFFYGYDAAEGPEDMWGFREMVRAEFDSPGGVSWPGLVLQLAFPDDSTKWGFFRHRDEADERQAIATLLAYLDRYVASCED